MPACLCCSQGPETLAVCLSDLLSGPPSALGHSLLFNRDLLGCPGGQAVGTVGSLVGWSAWLLCWVLAWLIAGWLVGWYGYFAGLLARLITGWSVGMVTLLGFGTVDRWLLRQAQHHLGGDAFLSGSLQRLNHEETAWLPRKRSTLRAPLHPFCTDPARPQPETEPGGSL